MSGPVAGIVFDMDGTLIESHEVVPAAYRAAVLAGGGPERTDAEVIAVDQHGRPALLRHHVGEGQTILCTYPLEHMAAVSAAVNPDSTAVLYAALAAEADVVPDLRVDSPEVIVGEMEHADGARFVWLINMTDVETMATPRGAELVTLDGDSVRQVTLPPFGVEVLRRL